MKNNLHISILLLASLIMLLPACEKEVPLEVEQTDQKLAILCTFSPGEPFDVELAKSTSLFHSNSNDNLIDDADIIICSDNYCAPALPLFNGDDNVNSKYQSSDNLIIPEESKDYNITINIDGFDAISAHSTIPQVSKISHSTVGEITKYPNEFESIQDYNIRLAFKFLDDQAEDNYYHVKFYQVLDNSPSNNVTSDPDTLAIVQSNQGFSLVDDKLSGNFTVTEGGILFKDAVFQKSLQELVFEPNFSFDNTKYEPVEIILELRTVSKEYYDYFSSAYRQNSQANVPFSDPTIIFSNVTNGLGVFAGYSKDQIKADIEF